MGWFFFGLVLGTCLGFMVAACMTAGSRADDMTEFNWEWDI